MLQGIFCGHPPRRIGSKALASWSSDSQPSTSPTSAYFCRRVFKRIGQLVFSPDSLARFLTTYGHMLTV